MLIVVVPSGSFDKRTWNTAVPPSATVVGVFWIMIVCTSSSVTVTLIVRLPVTTGLDAVIDVLPVAVSLSSVPVIATA